jgi:diketogulonate reductase-like aldo/keto reductase
MATKIGLTGLLRRRNRFPSLRRPTMLASTFSIPVGERHRSSLPRSPIIFTNLDLPANVYSNGTSEIILGKAIKKYSLPRHKIVVATKVFSVTTPENMPYRAYGKPKEDVEADGYVNYGGLSRKHIFDSVEASLTRLDLDYIDLLQIHR